MNPACQGCQKAINSNQSVNLIGGWSLGHYGGCEGFFGWLALQTREHRRGMGDLSQAEADALGPILQKLENGIYNYWKSCGCPVARVYVMYFLEGLIEGEKDQWHLHFHLVPRFNALDASMRDKVDVRGKKVCGIDAYLIAKLRPHHATYPLPAFLDRDAVKEPQRNLRELEIIRGVAFAAGLIPSAPTPPTLPA